MIVSKIEKLSKFGQIVVEFAFPLQNQEKNAKNYSQRQSSAEILVKTPFGRCFKKCDSQIKFK